MLAAEDVTGLLVQNYGPIAFGLIALLILWKAIVAPQMASSRLDLDALTKIAELNRETSRVMAETVAELKNLMDHRLMRSPTLVMARKDEQ